MRGTMCLAPLIADADKSSFKRHTPIFLYFLGLFRVLDESLLCPVLTHVDTELKLNGRVCRSLAASMNSDLWLCAIC